MTVITMKLLVQDVDVKAIKQNLYEWFMSHECGMEDHTIESQPATQFQLTENKIKQWNDSKTKMWRKEIGR